MVLINNIFLICGLLSVIAFNPTFAQRRPNLQCLHRCGNGICIKKDYICDGYSDCPDNSDEHNCPEYIDESNGCIVPEFPKNGYFLIESTNMSTNPGDILPESAVLVLKCNDSQHTSKTFCQNSQWSVDLECPSVCPPILPQRTTTIECYNRYSGTIRCDLPLVEENSVRFRCKRGYLAEMFDKLTCKDSRWIGKIPTCNKINRNQKTCVLPTFGETAAYTFGSGRVGLQAGGQVSDVAVLIFKCYDHTALDGESFSYCVNGSWTSLPKCRRLCDPLASSSVEYSCVQPSGLTSACEVQQPSGTIASSSCKSKYTPVTPLVQLRCNDGVWDNPLPRCSIKHRIESAPHLLLDAGTCIMPEHPPNGRYIAGSNRDILPGDELPGYAVLFTECDEGYATKVDEDYVNCNGIKGWGALSKCHKMCPPLIVPHVTFECYSFVVTRLSIDTRKLSCLEPMKHESYAWGDCKPSFFSDSIIPNRTCVDGIWDKPSPVCKPKQWGQYIPIASNGSCVLPDHDVDGQYVYPKDAELTTGDVVPDLSIIIHTCNHGYKLNGQNFSLCQSGSWNNIPKCLKTCDPLISLTVDLTCTHDGASVSCVDPLKNGTTVESKCKESYSPSVPVLPILVCINGNWNKEPPKCTPECGTIILKGQKNIINGSSLEVGEFPWHVGLYDISQNYLQICGGSIVNAIVVVTAAHCVWDNYGKRPASEYAVAGVKYYRDWKSDKENDNLVQRSMVTEIIIPDNYGGAELRQQSDIALLTLKTPFKFTSFIRPVCLDWDITFDKLHLSHGNFGKVTGWGLTDVTNADSASPILLTVQIPYVDYKQCRNETPIEFAKYLGIDKICAGYKNEGTAVCRGDSGGGLVFVSSIHSMERWYLRGIVSVGPKDELNPDTCHSEMYTGFTHVLSHAEWLKNEIYKRTPY